MCGVAQLPKKITRTIFLVFLIIFVVLIVMNIWFSSALASNSVLEIFNAGGVALGVGLVLVIFFVILTLLGVLAWLCNGNTLAKTPFGVCGCCMILLFALSGGFLISIGTILTTAVTQACEGGGSEYAETLNQIYTTADEYYGTTDCPLKTDGLWEGAPPPTERTYDPVNGACGVQWCNDDFFEIIYNNLPISDQLGEAGVAPEEGEATAADDYNTENAEAIENCEEWPQSDQSALNTMKKVMGFLGELEDKYECAGICTKQDIYYFSNVDNGSPT